LFHRRKICQLKLLELGEAIEDTFFLARYATA
jgi:hypothetical protein